jgi:hypothetical protein
MDLTMAKPKPVPRLAKQWQCIAGITLPTASAMGIPRWRKF